MLHENHKRGAYYLWRFMIDAKYQSRGYGRKALDLVIKRVRKKPRRRLSPYPSLEPNAAPRSSIRCSALISLAKSNMESAK